jgi:hypothetical protein
MSYLVSGCGVTFLCHNPDHLQVWIELIIEKGDVPVITQWSEKS